ncbi:MAG: hypothetical protein JJ863_14455 [Deltaproteobacteria bacterium]|nr:hypothetical protein [Deltaproteobacteria bacterium]
MRSALFTLALTLLTVASAAFLAPTRASACSCMQQSPADAAASADAIFEGRVVTVEAPPEGDQSTPVRVTVHVTQQWKGVSTEDVELTTAPNSAMCGYNFELDQVYLIYAYAEDGGLGVSLCSRTQPADQADEDRTHLGPGTTPVDPNAEDPGTPGSDEGSSDGTTEDDGSEGGTVSAGASAQAGCASCAASGTEGLPALLVPGLLFGLALRRR